MNKITLHRKERLSRFEISVTITNGKKYTVGLT